MLVAGLIPAIGTTLAQETGKKPSSYSPVVVQEDFASVMSRMKAAKPAIMQHQKTLLEERYDLSDRPAVGVTMSRGKAVQAGVRVKLRGGMTWERLAQMSPEDVRDKDVFPLGFMPLPHPNHREGGMLFPALSENL
jgi:cytochrome c peroxidase